MALDAEGALPPGVAFVFTFDEATNGALGVVFGIEGAGEALTGVMGLERRELAE